MSATYEVPNTHKEIAALTTRLRKLETGINRNIIFADGGVHIPGTLSIGGGPSAGGGGTTISGGTPDAPPTPTTLILGLISIFSCGVEKLIVI